MYALEDFTALDFMDIHSPNKGYFGYLLRCNCPNKEDVSGNFILLDDGDNCCVRFPSSARERANYRKIWNDGITRYHDVFVGQLFYIKEEFAENYIKFMTSGSEDAVRMFLKGFHAKMMAYIAPIVYNRWGIEPLFAVTHTCQLTADGRMNLPHIHVLWGIKNN